MDLETVAAEPVTLRAQAWGLASGVYGLGIGLLWLSVALDFANGGPVVLAGVVGLGAATGGFAAIGFLVGLVDALLIGTRSPLPRLLAVVRGALNAGNFGSLVGATAAAPAGVVLGSAHLAALVWVLAAAGFMVMGAAVAELGRSRPRPIFRIAARLLRWTVVSGAFGLALTSMPALMALAARLAAGADPSVALTVALVGGGGFAISGLVAGVMDSLTRP
jgi:hypothetical protein